MRDVGEREREDSQVAEEQVYLNGGLLQLAGSEGSCRDEQARSEREREPERPIGRYDPKERDGIQPEGRVEIYVLRVADGGEHGPQVGGDGLRHEGDDEDVLRRRPEQEQGERHEGYERDVIRDDHRGEERDEGEEHGKAAHAAVALREARANGAEHAGAGQAGDGGHETKQEPDGPEIDCREVFGEVLRGRGEGRHGGDGDERRDDER